MEISVYSDRGLVREKNEDSWLAIPPWCEPAISSKVCVFAVADGMGGHAGGEVASNLAINKLRHYLSDISNIDFSTNFFETVFLDVCSDVFKYAQAHPELKGMGTTLTALFARENSAIIAHVGDSRAYLARNNTLIRLTKDHTLLEDLLSSGKNLPNLQFTESIKHILSRALGVKEFVKVDTHIIDLALNDIVILCSDGITNMISENDIIQILNNYSFRKVAKALVMAANNAGGKDNSTVVAIKFDELPVNFPTKYSFSRFKKLLYYWDCLWTI